ncbi:MAG: alpha/beta hydrolase [Candidatus Xenobia bacterium]
MRHSWVRRLAWGSVSLALALLLITTILTCVLLFPVREPEVGTPKNFGLPYQSLTIPVDAECRLAAWFLPNPQAQGRTVAVLHGISSNKARMLPRAAALYRMGYNVFLLDQRRHGKSTGDFTTYGWLEHHDLDVAIQTIEQRPDVSKQGVVVVGFSMGAAIALQSLGDPQIRAVVADSPFADLPSMLEVRSEQWHVPSWPFVPLTEYEAGLLFNVQRVSPIAEVRQVDKPVLLIHGLADHSIPVAQARRLARAGAGHVTLWLVPGADHLGAAALRPHQYYARVGAFLHQAFGSTAVAAR